MTKQTYVGSKVLSFREAIPMVASNSYEIAGLHLNLIVCDGFVWQDCLYVVSILASVVINIVQ